MACRIHRRKASACRQPNVREDMVKRAFESVVNTIGADDLALREYADEISREFRNQNGERLTHIETRLPEIEKELQSLTYARNRNVISGAEFLNRQNEMKKEELDLQTELERLTDNRINQTEELLKLVHSRGGSFVFDENTFNLVERVTARGEELIFRFRCGFEMSVEIDPPKKKEK